MHSYVLPWNWIKYVHDMHVNVHKISEMRSALTHWYKVVSQGTPFPPSVRHQRNDAAPLTKIKKSICLGDILYVHYRYQHVLQGAHKWKYLSNPVVKVNALETVRYFKSILSKYGYNGPGNKNMKYFSPLHIPHCILLLL